MKCAERVEREAGRERQTDSHAAGYATILVELLLHFVFYTASRLFASLPFLCVLRGVYKRVCMCLCVRFVGFFYAFA